MKKFNGAAVARHQVFTLADGSFVVKWDEKRVQELLTGRYREFDHKKDFGHPITDYELRQLKAAGRVEHHTRTYVWLYALPEKGRFAQVRTLDRGDRVRVYYLTSTLPKTQLGDVEDCLVKLDLTDDFLARIRNGLVVILGKNGMPFRHLQDAERAQHVLEAKAPDLFTGLAVAFIESKSDFVQSSVESSNESVNLNLSELIASQSDTSVTEGRLVILAVNQQDEREEFTNLFINKMKMRVEHASKGQETIQLIEDLRPDLLVTDSTLPDMHVWPLLNKLKEIGVLSELPVIVVTDEPPFGANVAKVDYLVRPVAIARLRHIIWTILNAKNSKPNPPSS